VESVKHVLLTGVSGFIGRHVAEVLLSRGIHVTGMIRPNTVRTRLGNLADRMDFIECDLGDIPTLVSSLKDRKFDGIIHVGALRGGRKDNHRDFYRANVDATEQLAMFARDTGAKFVFCSSVGVFGVIPLELPANDLTTRQPDNYYHYTKIEAERIVLRLVMEGLNGVIIRPAITYGAGDNGFPRTLTRMTDRGTLFLPDRPVRIHLTEVHVLAEAFVRAFERDVRPGSAMIVADREPVLLSTLVDFIRSELGKTPYPKHHYVSRHWFDLAVRITKRLHRELWASRFELISRSWFYDTHDAKWLLDIEGESTIPTFKVVINDYRS
jgi:nucleoside-diphosphate-sugar epimerase